jgi:hypothetical protein
MATTSVYSYCTCGDGSLRPVYRHAPDCDTRLVQTMIDHGATPPPPPVPYKGRHRSHD